MAKMKPGAREILKNLFLELKAEAGIPSFDHKKLREELIEIVEEISASLDQEDIDAARVILAKMNSAIDVMKPIKVEPPIVPDGLLPENVTRFPG